MIYRVVITPEAETDLRSAYRYIRSYAPQAARDWIRRARQSTRSLARRPERCSLAPESASFDQPIRELLFGTGNRGTYRILFCSAGQICLRPPRPPRIDVAIVTAERVNPRLTAFVGEGARATQCRGTTAEYSHASSADSYPAWSPAWPAPESVSCASPAAG